MRLNIPNVYDFYAQSVISRLSGSAEQKWRSGSRNVSLLARLWSTGDRVVLDTSSLDDGLVPTLAECLGIEMTVISVPEDLRLSVDALDRLADSLRNSGPMDVYPWAWTSSVRRLTAELADRGVALEFHGLPARHQWIQDYLDSKAGFRHLLSRIGFERIMSMPEGQGCSNLHQALILAARLLRDHERVVLKADLGAGGNGQFLLDQRFLSWKPKSRSIIVRLAPLLAEGTVVCEVWESSLAPTAAHPSAFVMLDDDGITWQGEASSLVEGHASYIGAVAGHGALPDGLRYHLRQAMEQLARSLAELGYRGPLQLDAITRADGSLIALELNPRLSMTTHLYDVGRHLFGDTWQETHAIAGLNGIPLFGGDSMGSDELLSRLSGIVFQPGQQQGVLLTGIFKDPFAKAPLSCSLVSVEGTASNTLELMMDALQRLGASIPNVIREEAHQLRREGAKCNPRC